MLRTVSVLACALLLNSCATMKTWSTREQWMYGALLTCNAADAVQTRNAVEGGTASEGNPLLGKSPSDGRLVTVKLGQGYLITRAAINDPEHRPLILALTTGICGAILLNNYHQTH